MSVALLRTLCGTHFSRATRSLRRRSWNSLNLDSVNCANRYSPPITPVVASSTLMPRRNHLRPSGSANAIPHSPSCLSDETAAAPPARRTRPPQTRFSQRSLARATRRRAASLRLLWRCAFARRCRQHEQYTGDRGVRMCGMAASADCPVCLAAASTLSSRSRRQGPSRPPTRRSSSCTGT